MNIFRKHTCTQTKNVNKNKFDIDIRVFERICIEDSGFLEGIFAQIPRSPEGILKIPRATRRARGPERRPERGAKIHDGLRGSDGDSRTKNPNLVHIFFNMISLQPKITQQSILHLRNIYLFLFDTFNIHIIIIYFKWGSAEIP